jgi:hypothetical protein
VASRVRLYDGYRTSGTMFIEQRMTGDPMDPSPSSPPPKRPPFKRIVVFTGLPTG